MLRHLDEQSLELVSLGDDGRRRGLTIGAGGGRVAFRLIQLANEFVDTVKDARAVLDDVKAGKGAFALLKDEQLAPDSCAATARGPPPPGAQETAGR